MKKKSWVVRLRCVVIKEVCTDECTREEAVTNPWDHVVGGEVCMEQEDWTLVSIKENA